MIFGANDLPLSLLNTSLIAIIGYLIGSIPFGLLLTKMAGLGDIRAIGSGNIGATNVLRTGHKTLAAVTLLADILKGAGAVYFGSLWGTHGALLGGLTAFLGHLFPIWLQFRGGKGVATYIGVLLGIFWPAALVFCIVWLLVAVITRYSSLSALSATIAAAVFLGLQQNWLAVATVGLMTILVYIRHKDNILRLSKGEESKIGSKGK